MISYSLEICELKNFGKFDCPWPGWAGHPWDTSASGYPEGMATCYVGNASRERLSRGGASQLQTKNK